MTMSPPRQDVAKGLCDELVDSGFGPFFGTPCGILTRLYAAIDERVGLRTVAREDNAVGVAAGAALAGRCPAVLMQNSGLGQSVNAIASLVSPYRIPLLLVVSVRGMNPDPTQENLVMGELTEPLLARLGVPVMWFQPDLDPALQVTAMRDVIAGRRPAALLIPPTAFGWRA